MQLSAQTLIRYLEELAPKRLASDWDNVGLQLGSPQGSVKKVIVSLDVDEHVLDEAIAMGADFIVTHHPFIFRPLSALRTDLPLGKLIERAVMAKLCIYAAHTNLDVAVGGVNDALAERLQLSDVQVLRPAGYESLEKITVFIPAGQENGVRDAMVAAGAGWVGNYSHCTFQTSGTGTFMPREGTNPYVGQQGKLERVSEVRLESIYPVHIRNRVVRAMIKAHPYEKVAYDIYPLVNEGKPYGLGRVGRVKEPITLENFSTFLKEKLKVSSLRVAGDLQRNIKKVAVCGGAGGDLIHTASFAGADVLVTGDLKYHEAQDANALGLAVIDAGHDATERVVVPALCTYLRNKLAVDGYDVDVLASASETVPWQTI